MAGLDNVNEAQAEASGSRPGHGLLQRLGIEAIHSGACWGEWIPNPEGGELISLSPHDGKEIARVRMAAEEEYDEVVWHAADAFHDWRLLPAPRRGQIIRDIADELRRVKDDLGALVSLEMGKILPEGKGEVQEMIDIADFAAGLSRQLYGLSMHSERPGHRMYEQWHPLGPVGVITSFNFPVAVWAWNAMIAAVCGDCVLWKPSSDTPLTAIAAEYCNRVLSAWLAGSIQSRTRQEFGCWRAHVEGPARPADQRDGLHLDGVPRSGGSGQSPGTHTPRTGRQQRRDRDGRCGP